MATPEVPEEVVPEEEIVEQPIVEEPEVPEEVVEEEAPEEEVVEEEPKVSRRESLRIQALVEKMRNMSPAPAASPAKPADTLDYRTLDAEPETIEQLEADRRNYGEAQRRAGENLVLEQAKSIQFQTRLEIDAPRVEAKYPILDPHNEAEFQAPVANAINQWYLATTGYDSKTGSVRTADVRYADFVEGLMELAEVLAGDKTATATKAIKRQAAQTGIRPSGSSAKMNLNKPAHEMSDEELAAKMATIFPGQK